MIQLAKLQTNVVHLFILDNHQNWRKMYKLYQMCLISLYKILSQTLFLR
jgi:hypothetical protein